MYLKVSIDLVSHLLFFYIGMFLFDRNMSAETGTGPQDQIPRFLGRLPRLPLTRQHPPSQGGNAHVAQAPPEPFPGRPFRPNPAAAGGPPGLVGP